MHTSRLRTVAEAIRRTGSRSDDVSELWSLVVEAPPRPNPRIWRRAELAEIYGTQLIEGSVARFPAIALYLSEGIDFSHPAVRSRLAPGGDLREVLGADIADDLLSRGVVCSNPWLDAGGDPDTPPTQDEVAQALNLIVQQDSRLDRLRAVWNAAVTLHEQQALTAEAFANLLATLNDEVTA